MKPNYLDHNDLNGKNSHVSPWKSKGSAFESHHYPDSRICYIFPSFVLSEIPEPEVK